MKKILIILALLCSLTAFTIMNNSWVNDPPHSQLAFTVKHFSINEVTGYFKDFKVEIDAPNLDFNSAKISMSANISSIDTRVEARDNHLRSPDFFDEAKYPTLSFISTSISQDDDDKNEYDVVGDLTMHGITKQIKLELEYKGKTINPTNKQEIIAFVIKGNLYRSDFGIGSKFADNFISNKVEIRGDGEFVKR
ncbi:MAG TPA: YceI family protein [Candidatus Kapabacteria bacterium]|nr:YceI family protein [Candidatus Kapabacteria bacterium]